MGFGGRDRGAVGDWSASVSQMGVLLSEKIGFISERIAFICEKTAFISEPTAFICEEIALISEPSTFISEPIAFICERIRIRRAADRIRPRQTRVPTPKSLGVLAPWRLSLSNERPPSADPQISCCPGALAAHPLPL
jgi:hypothetical protein